MNFYQIEQEKEKIFNVLNTYEPISSLTTSNIGMLNANINLCLAKLNVLNSMDTKLEAYFELRERINQNIKDSSNELNNSITESYKDFCGGEILALKNILSIIDELENNKGVKE